MKTAYYLVVFILFTMAAFFVYTVVWLIALPFDRDRVVSHHYSRFWGKSIYGICPWWKIKVEGLGNIEKGKSYIVISNHQSMLDIPLLYNLPFNFKWVSKQEVFRIPVFGWVLWMHDDVAIKRGGAASTKGMMNRCDRFLKRGVSINIFPEGTRTKTGRVGEFKAGSFLLAKKTKAEILPVVINGNFDAFKGGEAGKFKIKTPKTFTVKIMPPISSQTVIESSINELCDMLHDRIEAEHRIIAPEFYETETTTTAQ